MATATADVTIVTPTTNTVVVTYAGARGQPGSVAAGVAFDDSASQLGASTMQQALDSIVAALRATGYFADRPLNGQTTSGSTDLSGGDALSTTF